MILLFMPSLYPIRWRCQPPPLKNFKSLGGTQKSLTEKNAEKGLLFHRPYTHTHVVSNDIKGLKQNSKFAYTFGTPLTKLRDS